MPLDQLHEHAGDVRRDRGRVVLICQSGRRAQQAEQALRASQMPNVHVLDGGMAAWLDLGMAVRRFRAASRSSGKCASPPARSSPLARSRR